MDLQHSFCKDSSWINGCSNPGGFQGLLQRNGLMLLTRGSEEQHEEEEHSFLCGSHRNGQDMHKTTQQSQEDLSRYYVALLKDCSKQKNLTKGCSLHAEILKKGLLERDTFVGNALVSMYAKCGSLCKSQEAFDKLPVRCVISWNALIAGYEQHGRSDRALLLYEQMQFEGVAPNVVTFVCCLKACASIKSLQKGQELHAEIARKGLLERHSIVGNALITMYVRCGLLAKAQEVFEELPARGVVTWNALITGYIEHGCNNEAFNLFERMNAEGLSPDAITYVCSLKACAGLGALKKGQKMHSEIARKGLLENVVVGSAVVNMYAKCGLPMKAQEVFERLPHRDVVSWNALISGYTDHGCGRKALNLFKRMQVQGISPNAITFVCSLKACGSIGAVDEGQDIHAEIARKGLIQGDIVIGNALVDMYAKCGALRKAQEVFDMLPDRDLVSWNALLAGYAEHGHDKEALNFFQNMQLEGISPNAVTYACSLKACASVGAIGKGQELHAEIAKKGLLENNNVVATALVDMYAKCGLLAKALEIFDKLPVRDIVTWNALITGYTQVRDSAKVFDMFEKMIKESVKPDSITFLSVLVACSHLGLVDKGQAYFKTMYKDYGISPTLEHHRCMVDLLGRAGQLDKAFEMIKRMLSQADLVIWCTLLGACCKWGSFELGREAFNHIVQLDARNPVPYVCMSNIYVDAGMYEEASKIEAEYTKQAWIHP